MMKAKQSIGRFFRYVRRHPMMYLMLIPGLFFLFIYKFAPLYGILIAFKDYNIFAGNTVLGKAAVLAMKAMKRVN